MRHILTILSMILATSALSARSPYISTVYDYSPAPGQFINELPEYEEGDTYASMLSKAAEQLVGEQRPGMVSLGGFGGYIVFGFDHPVVNKPGDFDFKIYGNAMISDRDNGGGNAEPGIVMVSRDDNGNGLPDDKWFELAGSDYHNTNTIKGYTIAYTRPDDAHLPDPDPEYKYITDRTYIRWTANSGSQPEGYIMRNTNHTQPYWPQWIDDATLTFTGTRLADNFVDISGNGTYFVQRFLDWGYADNLPNNEDKGFDIGWAVDADGKTVELNQIDFIRVHTGVNQYCGWLGETSTEISGAEDLHPDLAPSAITPITLTAPTVSISHVSNSQIDINCEINGSSLPFSITRADGTTLTRGTLRQGSNMVNLPAPARGVCLLITPVGGSKFIIK